MKDMSCLNFCKCLCEFCSVIERSNLAALEFLMSKQPRGNVRVGAGNTAGVRVSNIFVDVEKFQQKFKENKDRTTVKHSKVSVILDKLSAIFPQILHGKI